MQDNYSTFTGTVPWAIRVHHFNGEGNRSVTDFTIIVANPDRPQDSSAYIPIKVWDENLQTIAQTLTEGSKIHVEGRMTQESWKDKNGKWVRKLVVIADRLTDPSTGETTTPSTPDTTQTTEPTEARKATKAAKAA